MELEIVASPRIEIVLAHPSKASGRLAIWLLLHVPDGGSPTTIRMTKPGQDVSQVAATLKLSEIFVDIGERHAFEGTDSPDRVRPS